MAKRRRKKKGQTSIILGIIVLVFIVIVSYYGEDILGEDLSFSLPEFTFLYGSDNEETENNSNTVVEVTGDLQIYFLDVGQADATLIRCGDNNVLIDAGNNEDGEKLVTYFESLGITSFDYLVGTHAHEDHIGGMDNIIESFDISNYYMPDVISTSKTFEDVLDALENKNLTYSTPEVDSTFTAGECIFTTIYVGSNANDLNNTSIVLRLDFGSVSVLFTGDAEESVEEQILNKNIDTDVLKVGHHGSNTSNSLTFLKKVSPLYAVIEVGEGNSYGHPSSTTLSNLTSIGATIYRTDEDGTVILTSDGTNISFRSIETDTNG